MLAIYLEGDMPKKKVYSKETIRSAVVRVMSGEISIRRLSKEIGCSYGSLRRWVADYKTYGEAVFSKEGTYFVYMHVSPAPSNKVYIGQTKQNPVTRWHYGTGYHTNKYFSQAIKKYGWKNFEHKILFYGLSHEEANEKETELIKKYRANDRRYGYNITEGGDGSHGVIVSKETREKISRVQRGKKISDYHKNRISLANGHPVKQYTLSGECIAQFHSTGEAARHLGKPSSQQAHIVACCNGKRHQAYGYRWSWEEDSKPPLELEVDNNRERAVSQYHLDGRYITTYKSLKRAGIAITGFERAGDSIQVCCAGRSTSAYGYIWRYSDSDDQRDIVGLKGHPQYGEVKKYLGAGHTKIEASTEFGIPLQTLYRYLYRAERDRLSDDECIR